MIMIIADALYSERIEQDISFLRKSNPAFSAMEHYRQERLFTDVIIKVNSKMFPAHRAVLAASIPYFNITLIQGVR